MVNPLLDFLKTKGIGSTTTNFAPTIPTPPTIPLTPTPLKSVTALDVAKEIPSVAGTGLRWIGKELMKPISSVAAVTEQVGKAISGGGINELKQIPKKVSNVISGKTERSFSDIWREALPGHPVAGTVLGTIVDIAADPLNFIGGGLTKAGKLAEKASALNKANEAIVEGSRLAEKIKKAGLTAEQLKIGATKAEQAAKGQRAFLQFARKPILSQKTSEAIYKATGKLGESANKIPIVQALNKMFSTSSHNKELDQLIQHYKDLGDFRRAQILEEAKNIQKEVTKLKPEEIIQISNKIEKGIESSNPSINKLADKLSATYKDWKSVEKQLGVKGGELAQYVPHIPTSVKEGGGIRGIVREFSSKLGGAEKQRNILKFIDEKGNEVIGKADNLGLKKISTDKLVQGIEKKAAKQTEILQNIQKQLAQPELANSMENWKIYLSQLRKNISSNNANSIIKTLDEPTQKEFGNVIKSIINQNDLEMSNLAKELETQIMTSQGKEFLYQPLKESAKASREVKIVNLQKKIIDVQNKTNEMVSKLSYYQYIDKNKNFYRATQASIDEINKAFEKTFFEENPAIQMAYRGIAHAKAITSQEFFQGVKQFATDATDAVASTAPELKGLKFAPEVADAIDSYYKSIKPEEIRAVFKLYDGVLGWWKANALLGPSYHTRNAVSNLWNNFLNGVKNPLEYIQAGLVQMGKKVEFTDDAGRVWTEKSLLNSAKRTGVLNEGWYAADIPQKIEAEISKGNWNPLSQKFKAFKLNRQVGTAIENNARLALFINRIKKGDSIDKAAMTVKKYLFDYTDLTDFEKIWMKRIFPFWTWSRKNLPLQLEHLIKEPGKYAGLEKVIRSVEQISMGDSKPANEKYLSDYIKGNTAMRVGYNEKEKIYYYFLLGNWMPSYQMMDFISQPMENLMQMLTPALKTPMEMLVNKSLFFRNTLGDYQTIENYPGESVNFLGLNMPKKTATFLRNIRILNELDKLNPGKIFGGKSGEKSLGTKLGLPAVDIPKLGVISPALEKYKKTEPAPTPVTRTAGLFLGKLQSYKEGFSRNLYQMDTQKRVDEIKRNIKSAAKKGDKERIKLLNQRLRDFLKERGK